MKIGDSLKLTLTPTPWGKQSSTKTIEWSATTGWSDGRCLFEEGAEDVTVRGPQEVRFSGTLTLQKDDHPSRCLCAQLPEARIRTWIHNYDFHEFCEMTATETDAQMSVAVDEITIDTPSHYQLDDALKAQDAIDIIVPLSLSVYR